MFMYLVLCYDNRTREWFAYSSALKTKEDAENVIAKAKEEFYIDAKAKLKILQFWLPPERI